MTREDILCMAREAGITFRPMTVDGVEYEYQHIDCNDDIGGDEAGCIERFAALVAAAEREACALECDKTYHQHIGDGFGEVRYGIAACAAAIRARSK